METTIYNDYFQEILKLADCGGMMMKSIISFAPKKIFSVQQDENTRAIRFFEYKHNCTLIGNATESVEVDVSMLLKIVKRLPKYDILSIKAENDRLIVKGKNVKISLLVNEPENILSCFTKKQLPTTANFTMKKSDFEKIVRMRYLRPKPRFYIFDFHKNQLCVTCDNSAVKYYFNVFNCVGKARYQTKKLILPKIAKLFDKHVHVKMGKNMPIWLYDETDDYTFGVSIPTNKE